MPGPARRALPPNNSQTDVGTLLSSIDRVGAAGLVAVARLVGYAVVLGFALYGLIRWLLK